MTSPTPSLAARFALLGIITPVRQQDGADGIGELVDANGASLLQIDPLGIREDDEVAAIANAVADAINHAVETMSGGRSALAETLREYPDLSPAEATALIATASAEAAAGGL